MVNSLNLKKANLVFVLIVMLMALPLRAAFSEDHESVRSSRRQSANLNTDPRSNSNENGFGITIVNWNPDDSKLYIEGYGAGRKKRVTVSDAGSGTLIGTTRSEDDGKFKFEKSHIEAVSCEIEIRRFDNTRIRKDDLQ